MTEDRLPLAEQVAKVGDAGFLHSVAEAVLRMLMEAYVEGLIGAVVLEANDEWQVQLRYRVIEAIGEMLNPPPTNETRQHPPKAT